MHANFKPHNDRGRRRQVVDGFLNAPTRNTAAPNGPFNQRTALSGDQLRPSSRTIGDFRRPEGYHASNAIKTGQGQGTATAVPQASKVTTRPIAAPRSGHAKSLLHTTLPGARQAAPANKPKKGLRRLFAHPKKTVRSLMWGGVSVLGICIIMGSFLIAKGYFNANKVFRGGGSAAALNSNVNPTLLKGEGDGRINILLTGKGGEGHDGADLTDTILIASIDPVGKTAGLVSIPRDMWVTTDDGTSSKINAVYAHAKNQALRSNSSNVRKAEEAGIKALQEVATDVLGLNIHYYGTVDFSAFKQAVDTVGGVDIHVPEELAVTERLWDTTTGKSYYLNVPAGQQHFDGTRALFFSRSRHTSARGDFDRAERQRLFIAALSQKVLSAGTYTNPVKISQLMDNFGDHVATDLSINDAVRLMTIGKGIGSKFDSIDLAAADNPLVRTGAIGGQSVVMPSAGIGDYSEIHSLLRSRLKDGYIVKENAAIAVLNGTVTPGLAAEKAEALRSYGYNVTTVATAPTQAYEKTVIVDLTKGKKPYTKNYLEKRFGVKATTTLPDRTIEKGDANFVIILGQNETIDL